MKVQLEEACTLYNGHHGRAALGVRRLEAGAPFQGSLRARGEEDHLKDK